MSDYKNVLEYLDEQNTSFEDPNIISFVVLAVACTVIPLHTQKTKFLASRNYWLYFDQYRIKLNINQLRDIMKKGETISAQEDLKKHIKNKKNILQKLNVDDYKKEIDRDTTQTVVNETHVNKDIMKYVFIENNSWWFLEYFLYITGIIASIFLMRQFVILPTGRIINQTDASTSITHSFDFLALTIMGVLIYYLDDDYRNPSPSAIKSNMIWKILYSATIGLLIIGHVIWRYVGNYNFDTLFDRINLNTIGYTIFGLFIIVSLNIVYNYLTAESELFISNFKEFKKEEEEESIQDLINEQSRLN